uniref:Alpha/beta hydrolase fold-3 domain-containing protein n=1 Tax=Tetradesmus obliquus TaxID=3088 RepID=A0A383W7S7_TETOB
MEKGCMVDFRPLLSGLSLLQFYPGLRLQRVNAGGCKAYWMRLRGGREVQHAQVVLFYVHGGAFVGGDACMTAWTFQHWMQRLAGSGLHAVVLSVEYPLAPERRFPAAVVDTAAAYTWLRQQLQQQGSSACIIPVADSAGANILVAALTALRDISSGSSMDELLQGAVAQTAAAEQSNDQHSSAEAAAEVQDAVAELFTSLKDRLCQINGSSSSSSNALSRASSSSSSNTGSSGLNVSSSLATALSSSGSTTVPDMTAQIGASAEITRAAGSSGAAAAAAAAAAFVPPAAMVLVSPAMDISEQACFYDEEWRAQHEPRFDYLPVSVVGGGMHHYVGSTALLACGYVSPLHAASLAGLAGGPWLVLAGGAELMARDIDRKHYNVSSSCSSSTGQENAC